MIKQELLVNQQQTNTLTLVAATDGTNVDLFAGYDVPSIWKVYINDILTNQQPNDLTFSQHDIITIQYDETPIEKFSCRSLNYFSTIQGSIPKQNDSDFSYCFYGCSNLTSLSSKLLINNDQITSMQRTFAYTNIVTIPDDLLSYCSKLTTLRYGFAYNQSLINVPFQLLINNTELTELYATFHYCKQLTVNIKIASQNITSCGNFASSTSQTGTVYVPADSTTKQSFASNSNTNVNIIEY